MRGIFLGIPPKIHTIHSMIYIFGAAFDPPHVGHSAIVRALLHYKNPEKIVLIPSSKRNDKSYHVNDEHRLAMLQIFVSEIGDERVIIDDYFIKNWEGEMITRDIDMYARKKYSEDIVHVFGTDTIFSMPEWDEEGYAAKVIKKLFVPRLSESSPQWGELEGCVVPEIWIHPPVLPILGRNETTKIVSESSPQWGELEGCVTFISPKSHIYLKEYASELRKNQTYPEFLAWKDIFSKKQFLGYKVLRQHTLWPYIVDFYIHALKLIIEIDGDVHSLQKEKDIIRDIFFVKHGYRVIRIPAFEILWNMSWVYDFLSEYVTHPPNPPNIGRDWNPHPPNLPNIGRDWNPHPPSFLFSGEELLWIANYELFTDSHIPDVSSTEIRNIIPEHTTLKTLFEENPKFIIKWLSNQISRYILEHRLYRPKLEQKPKILVHVCCGPDVTMPILQLRDEYDVICFWYDPNIQPKSEYDKRYEAFVRVCEIENIPYIKWAYDVGNFFTRIRGVEHTPERWEKCTYCYDMRMMVSAKLAKRLKIPLYTSSLNTSPKKDLEKLFKMGHLYAEKYGVEFLDIPFRKRWWFEKSVEYTRENDIYRQNYCGCIYSIREGGESEMKKRMVG
jgi:epoxyqueuosine reductase